MEVPKVGSTQADVVDLRGRRDAFHVPSVLVRTNYKLLSPGERVKFLDRKCQTVGIVLNGEDSHAIVDPFLTESPQPGQCFWVFVKPELVGKFSHHFEVEGFPTAAELWEEEHATFEEYDECRGCY